MSFHIYIYIDTCMDVTYLGMGFLVPTFMFEAVSCNLDMEAPVVHTTKTNYISL